jgi:hypothetical protein
MKSFNIVAPIKLLSLNNAFVTLRNGRRCRSKSYVEFTKKINAIMISKAKEFQEFNEAFNPKEHELHAHLIFFTPDLYTKAGTINKKSSDLGNLEKCLIDNVLTGTIEDSSITFWIMQKRYAADYAFLLNLKIMPMEK